MASGPAELSRLLGQIVEARVAAARGLLDELEIERAALTEADLSRLDGAAKAKARLTGDLESLASQQQQLLAGFGEGTNGISLQRALDWCGDETLQQQQVIALDLMTQCNRNNQRNGMLLQHRLDYIRRALGVLRDTGSEAPLYGPDGREPAQHGSGLIGRG